MTDLLLDYISHAYQSPSLEETFWVEEIMMIDGLTNKDDILCEEARGMIRRWMNQDQIYKLLYFAESYLSSPKSSRPAPERGTDAFFHLLSARSYAQAWRFCPNATIRKALMEAAEASTEQFLFQIKTYPDLKNEFAYESYNPDRGLYVPCYLLRLQEKEHEYQAHLQKLYEATGWRLARLHYALASIDLKRLKHNLLCIVEGFSPDETFLYGQQYLDFQKLIMDCPRRDRGISLARGVVHLANNAVEKAKKTFDTFLEPFLDELSEGLCFRDEWSEIASFFEEIDDYLHAGEDE